MNIVKPKWLFTARIERLKVTVGKIGRRWIIARDRSPKFCFEGRSSDEVKATASRAIKYYRKVQTR